MELTKKGLTGFQLKYLAMILMVLDHVQYFFEFTGKIPIWFSMLGRVSAPLFLFCVLEGFIHTHNRKKYFLQIYSIAIVMGLIMFSIVLFGLQRPDGFYPQNQMLATLSILLVILQGIDWCSKKQWGKGLAAIIIPTILPFVAIFIGSRINSAWLVINILNYSILPLHTWIMDGGTYFILQGVLMYAFRKNRKVQVVVFVVSTLILYGVLPLTTMEGITLEILLTKAFEWMSIFAAIPMLLYNGERGKGNKKFFYWFYPGHVYVLCALSYVLFYIIN
jgi:hypothetical protein